MHDASISLSGASSNGDRAPMTAEMDNRLNIVIVDDQTSARTMLRHVIEDIAPELSVRDFGDSQAALAWCEAGKEVLHRIRATGGVT